MTDRIPREVTAWPKIVVRNEALEDEDEVIKDYALIVKINNISVRNGLGLSAWTTAQLRDPQGEVLWVKNVKYQTKDLQRQCKLDTLEADNGKLLLEELEFAVLHTVSALIKDLNGETPKI